VRAFLGGCMTVRILFGQPPRQLRLYATRHYVGSDILWRLQSLANRNQPLFLQVENVRIPLARGDLRLAAEASAAYHNEICYNVPPDDGWADETARMEHDAEQHMRDPPSDESDDEHERSF